MDKKEEKYLRVIKQIKALILPVTNPASRMATICAVLHYKFPQFFWTGFYFLTPEKELEVTTYQGPLACLRLKKDTGVCWASINQKDTIIVSDVHSFEGHIACNPLSKSEIVIPVFHDNQAIGVLDIDSDKKDSFDNIDAKYLEEIVNMIYFVIQ
ncbi:MAG: GAF domain-containing protein [Bacteroidales bacterium]|nr:GAF domain-containing protein [Bacteroidales bacterium]MDD4216885.1 GAF domain-containing protein [Bacteroidales bacterium]MDY0140591.1 GAF domain-containing protein [Bacteroidales bacterium]